VSSERRLNIGVTCFPTFGGSGIIATEIGLSLAKRGHQVHFVCAEVPWRFDHYVDNAYFHEVQARDYPLFDKSPYALALTSKLVEVCERHAIDVLHVHYAIPHATSAYLAKEILGSKAPVLITTLHGTDITVVGNDPSFLPITRFSIQKSDVVTTPSLALKKATYENLELPPGMPIEVISNFVDTEIYRPPATPHTGPARLVHNSNFRPVKRVEDVIHIFARVRHEMPAELVLIGDGPERSRMERLVQQLKLTQGVRFLGKQLDFVQVLQGAQVFLLPSETESFGLAALEAMSCGVPVVASRVGGLGEVIIDGECGFLRPVEDVESMAEATLKLLQNAELQRQFSLAARARAMQHFPRERIVSDYERCYFRALASGH
jgi:L-malate glycosyltransferase